MSMSAGYLTGGRGRPRRSPYSTGFARPMTGGKGKPFSRKMVFGTQRIKNFYGPAGHGRVHYESRIGMKDRFTDRQKMHNEFIKRFIKARGKPGSRAGAQQNMRDASAAWTAQYGKVATYTQVVKG